MLARTRPTFLLASLLLLAALPAQSAAQPAAPATSATPLTAEQVTAIVQHAHEKFGCKGLEVAVIQDGEVLAEVACGERGADQPMTPNTLCNIASCTKAFTAAAIATLVQEGKLGWDDRVVDHVPEFRMADSWITAHMTIADLLSHRCGLVTFAGDLLWYGSDYDETEVLRRIEKLPITQRFRDQFGYQNLMYMVAGLVVQRTTGQSWEDYVTEHFFAPLGMKNSRTSAQRLPADAERATPHIDGEAIVDHEFVACKPAASIYASVHELTAWMRMLLAGGKWQGKTMLGEASLRELWRPHVNMDGGSGAANADFRSYGMGWFLSFERGQKVVEHDGGMPGFLSKVSLLPAERFGFVLLNNANDGIVNEALKRAFYTARAGGDAMAVLDRIAEIGKRIKARDRSAIAKREAARRAGTQPSRPLADYAGDYEDEVYGPAKVTLEGDALHVVLVPSKRRLFGAMSHWHDDTFRCDFPDKFLPFALIRFELDSESKVTGFRIDCPIADFDFGALDFRRKDAAEQH